MRPKPKRTGRLALEPLEPRWLLDGSPPAAGLADFATEAKDVFPLRITEIMYNPADPSAAERAAGFDDKDDFEFIELQNIGMEAIQLDGVSISGGIGFTFGDIALQPAEHVVVVKDQTAFRARYGTGVNIAGSYTNSLGNGGEHLLLSDSVGATILDFDYLDDDWYPITDGGGFSLVIVHSGAEPSTWGMAASWRPSGWIGGSPGEADPGPNPGDLVINELLSHTDGFLGDWVELHNTTDHTIAVGGWFLSDNHNDLMKYRIAEGTEILPGGFLVLTQLSHFGVGSGNPGSLVGFGFSELGEEACLTSAQGDVLGGYRISVGFGAGDREISFGRYVTSTGAADFTALSYSTFNDANAPPRVGPVVINEIMYRPASGSEEFLELHNTSSWPVSLYDPFYPANTWRLSRGVQFSFPEGVTIPGGGYALVVPIDPAEFRATHQIPPTAAVFGPYSGSLSDSGEDVVLSRPGDPELDGFVPYVAIDQVAYGVEWPWPVEANVGGVSLARAPSGAYGNDPIHWGPSLPGGSPGRVNYDDTPPSPPQDLFAGVPSHTQIDLAWDPAIDPESGIDHYRIYRDGIAIGNSATTTFSDVTAQPATLYTYEISAVNGQQLEGNRSTPWSVAVMTIGPAQVIDDQHVQIAFSEAVVAAAAENATRYSIDAADVLAAALQPDGQTVVLTTSILEPGQPYTLTASGIPGLAGGVLAADTAVVFTGPTPTIVAGRYVFYNRSAFDADQAAANDDDDNAVAVDKQPLMPGQTATLANYTNYSRGINGIMIDVDGPPATLTAADFRFRVGNDNDPAGWNPAPDPISVSTRPGAGAGGADRVTVIWDDSAVAKAWLQVTVLSNAHTGLSVDDVFYFGNAVGEAGDSTTDAKVNASDMLLARNNPRTFLNPAPVDFACDFNRDARVNATDMLIARNNQTHFLNALRLISVPASKAAGSKSLDAPAESAGVWVFEVGQLDVPLGASRHDRPAQQAVDLVLAGFDTQDC
ncbi:MAG: lamin tail domain-containing protein [Pirellulales bacterium]|nr:lamin tail domain-containing protein [Pirellulales bacterium]